jgi:hypothetical protein
VLGHHLVLGWVPSYAAARFAACFDKGFALLRVRLTRVGWGLWQPWSLDRCLITPLRASIRPSIRASPYSGAVDEGRVSVVAAGGRWIGASLRRCVLRYVFL